MSLSKFNQKYKTDFSENTTELDALSKNIGDEGLKILCSVKFKKLDQLLLEENDIQNIDCLPKNHFGKDLIALDLSTNKISNIEPLAKVVFPNLHHLFLNSNKISSIDIFKKSVPICFPSTIGIKIGRSMPPSDIGPLKTISDGSQKINFWIYRPERKDHTSRNLGSCNHVKPCNWKDCFRKETVFY